MQCDLLCRSGYVATNDYQYLVYKVTEKTRGKYLYRSYEFGVRRISSRFAKGTSFIVMTSTLYRLELHMAALRNSR
jgi:hypothetical protein